MEKKKNSLLSKLCYMLSVFIIGLEFNSRARKRISYIFWIIFSNIFCIRESKTNEGAEIISFKRFVKNYEYAFISKKKRKIQQNIN